METNQLEQVLDNFTETEISLAYKDKLLEGVNYLADVVKVTLGARGKNVLFNGRLGKPLITKDGVTAARQVRSDDPYENMAIQIVREAAENTVKTSGDGTTTTLILSQYLINNGFKLLQEGVKFYDLSREMDEGKDYIVQRLMDKTMKIEDHFEKLRYVATVSSTSEEIGNYIFQIMENIGIYGAIEVKKSGNVKDKLDQVKGIKISKGFYAPHFLNDLKRNRWQVKDPYIVLFDDTVRTWQDIQPYMEQLEKQSEPILFMVNEVEPTILQSLINTKLQVGNSFNIMFVEHDGFGDRKIEIMNDIAALTGATVATADELGTMGVAEEVIVSEGHTSILGGHPDDQLVQELIEDTKYKLSEECDLELDDDEIKYYKRRLATLAGGVAIIHVGGVTEVEMSERKDRIDDAVEAVRAAIDRGISIGGGYAFNKVSMSLLDNHTTKHGHNLVAESIKQPFTQLCLNAGVEAEKRRDGLIKGKGYDVITDKLVDLEDYTIYDPTGVLIDSISNAVAVAKSVLSIECSIYNG